MGHLYHGYVSHNQRLYQRSPSSWTMTNRTSRASEVVGYLFNSSRHKSAGDLGPWAGGISPKGWGANQNWLIKWYDIPLIVQMPNDEVWSWNHHSVCVLLAINRQNQRIEPIDAMPVPLAHSGCYAVLWAEKWLGRFQVEALIWRCWN